MSDALRIGAILLLVLGNAIFVAAEYALVTARRNRLEERSAKGGRAARTALHLMDDPVRLISTVQIAITVFGIALGAVGEPLVAGYFGGLPRSLAFVLSFAVLTYLSVALGELIPKALALQKAEAIAVALAVPINFLSKFLYPIVWVLQRSAGVVLRVMGIKPAPAGMITYTREDILQSVAAAEDVGEIEQAEEEMLYKVFDFAGKEVEEVMVPRPEVVAVNAALPPTELLGDRRRHCSCAPARRPASWRPSRRGHRHYPRLALFVAVGSRYGLLLSQRACAHASSRRVEAPGRCGP